MFFDKNFENTKHLLDYSSLRNKTIGNNLSNINTPNYKRKHVEYKDFEKTLEKELKITNEKHINSINNSENFQILEDMSRGRNDNNNVNLDTEMMDLAKNSLLFKAYTENLTSQFNILDEVISGNAR